VTKPKIGEIKQSLLCKDDKWAVCGRKVVVTFFLICIFMAQCHNCVCTLLKEYSLEGNYHLKTFFRKRLDKNRTGMRWEKVG